MNSQQTINKYFRVKTNLLREMNSDCKRNFNLSLNKSPNKLPKLKNENGNNQDVVVVDLVSDDEETISSTPNKLNQSVTNSSQSTLDYTPEKLHTRPSASLSQKSLQTPSSGSAKFSNSPNSETPTRKRKFYSPSKKRSVSVITHSKVKRNLSKALSVSGTQTMSNNDDFLEDTQDVDDITMFLLKTINQFLCNEHLKPLLSQSSCDLLSNAMKIKNPGMRLVCRLYWQQDGWRRWEKVKQIMTAKSIKGKYDDTTLRIALSSLIESGFITLGNTSHGQDIKFDDLVKLLKLEELKAICKDLKIKFKNKSEITQSLKKYCLQKKNMTNFLIGNGNKSTNQDRALTLMRTKLGLCYKLADEAQRTLTELYTLIYLGLDGSVIREKRLELMLLNEKLHRETYPIDKNMEIDDASVVFKNRDLFVSYMDARSLYEDFEKATEVQKCEIVTTAFDLYNGISEEEMTSYFSLPKWLYRFTSPYIYVKILEAGIPVLKKGKVINDLNLAVDILTTLIKQNAFRQRKKGNWYSEKSLILDKLLNRPNEAAEILIEGFNSPLPEELKDFICPRAELLARRQKNPIDPQLKEQLLEQVKKREILERNIPADHFYKQPMDNTGKGKIKFQTRRADGVVIQDAEEYCISHYINQGTYTCGGHWEGRLIKTIFFLLFWDIIYKPLQGVRGIFLSYYQSYPLDMFCESFYTNRKALIEERLKEIEESPIQKTLLKIEETWNGRPESELSGVQRAVPLAALLGACEQFPPRALAALCRRLARLPAADTGFPDLTLWSSGALSAGQIAFVEVKTDSDKPSVKQIQWLHYMRQHGIEARFCYVGVNTARARSRNIDDFDLDDFHCSY